AGSAGLLDCFADFGVRAMVGLLENHHRPAHKNPDTPSVSLKTIIGLHTKIRTLPRPLNSSVSDARPFLIQIQTSQR
ncbi:hypothetical protein ABE599_21560, partial [Achromobacter mucicolens]|uniref:hypothetical protein n=1 Tax=Achromobacter mucicolens TaxID=1389922 RepID=UPI00320B01B5